MRKVLAALVAGALLAAACGGGGSDDSDAADSGGPTTDDSSTTETETTAEAVTTPSDSLPGDLPARCMDTPFDLNVNADGIAGLDGTFTVETALAKPQPVVPNPDLGGDGGDEQTTEEFLEGVEEAKRLAAETDLLIYIIWLADFAFDADDIAFFGGPDPEPGGTVLGLSMTPADESGLAAGDVVQATDEIQYETFTSLGPMLSYLRTDLAPDTFLLYSGEPTGSAEILYLDESWICVSWNDQATTSGPDGDVTISGVILAQLTAREELPLS